LLFGIGTLESEGKTKQSSQADSHYKRAGSLTLRAPLGKIFTFMRFPLPLTAKIAAYVIGHKLRGTKKFATVLQLEPLHTWRTVWRRLKSAMRQ
jgi:hypothetical protein